jgi:hypothetical protein
MFDDLDDIVGLEEDAPYKDEGDFFDPDDSEVRGAEAYLDAERGIATADALEREGGKSQAFDLVKEALAGGLGPSQEMYEILGNLLAEKRANRQQRVIIRKARRILEQSFGLDAVRKTVAPASSSYTRIPTPAMEQRSDGGFVGPALVVHRFDRKQRRIRGGGTRQYFAPGTTYTGYDAVTRAVDEHRQTLQNRLDDLIARRDKLGPGVSSERRRRLLNVNIKAVQEELAQYAPQERQRPVRSRGMRAPETAEEVAQMMLSSGASMGPIKTYLTSTGRNRGEIRTALRKIYGGVDAYDRAASDYILTLEKQIESLKKSSSSERDVIEARIRLLKKEAESTAGTISRKPQPRQQTPGTRPTSEADQSEAAMLQAALASQAEAERAQALKQQMAKAGGAVPQTPVVKGDRIQHDKYGPGLVNSVIGSRINVHFFDGTKKDLSPRFYGRTFKKA